MQTMDNGLIIKTMEKCALHAYLKTLIEAELDKLVLYSSAEQAAVEFVMVKDLAKINSLNGGQYKN